MHQIQSCITVQRSKYLRKCWLKNLNLASAVSAVLFCACNDPLFSGIPPKRFGTYLIYGDIYCTDCNPVSRLLAYKGKRCRKKIFSLRKPPTFGDATGEGEGKEGTSSPLPLQPFFCFRSNFRPITRLETLEIGRASCRERV